eukprot:g4455.t1
MTLKAGCGIGYEFSTLRPKGAYVSGAGAYTSGALSFMDIYDKMCFTVSSAGGRRGAQMATFDISHPDVVDFIRAKREDGRLRQFNLSLLITQEFIEAVKADADWKLSFPLSKKELDTVDIADEDQVVWRPFPTTEGYVVNDQGLVACKVYKTIKAQRLWDMIMSSTYDFAEPGFILIDKVNEMNNNWWTENIRATNPCGEQPLPPYGSCLLGSVNLTKFVLDPFTENARFDWEKYREVVGIFTRMLDNVVEINGLPLDGQRKEILYKRRHGMGFLGLGSTATMLGMKYGDENAIEFTESIAREMAMVGWQQALELAQEKGPAPIMDDEFEVTQEMLNARPEMLKDGINVDEQLPDYFITSEDVTPKQHVDIQAAAQKWVDSSISKTANVPTDYPFEDFKDIYLYAYDQGLKGCTTFRFNPEAFQGVLVKEKDLENTIYEFTLEDGSKLELKGNEEKLNSELDIQQNKFKIALSAVGKDTMTVKIEKKIVAYKVQESEEAQSEQEEVKAPELQQMTEHVERPERLVGSTYKIKTPLSEHAMYITVNDIVLNEGTEDETHRPFEVFINSKNMEHFQWVVALTRLISAVFRKGGDATFMVEELKAVFDPKGGYFKKGGVFMPSIVAEIGYAIEDHMKKIGMINNELDDHQKAFIEKKKQELSGSPEPEETEARDSGSSDYPDSATVCAKCSTKAVGLVGRLRDQGADVIAEAVETEHHRDTALDCEPQIEEAPEIGPKNQSEMLLGEEVVDEAAPEIALEKELDEPQVAPNLDLSEVAPIPEPIVEESKTPVSANMGDQLAEEESGPATSEQAVGDEQPIAPSDHEKLEEHFVILGAEIRADMNNPEIAQFTEGFDKMVVVHSPGSEGMLRTAAVESGMVAVTMEIDAPEGGVRGRVYASGMPAAGAEVEVAGEVVFTDNSGSFQIQAPRGVYDLLVIYDGDVEIVDDLRIVTNAIKQISDIELGGSTQPSGRLSGISIEAPSIEELDVKKTFLAYMPGETTGGNLEINTRAFPDQITSKISISIGGNADITGDEVAADSYDGDFDVFGFDDGSRAPNRQFSDVVYFDAETDTGTVTGDQRTGFAYSDETLRSDSYDAEMQLNAAYVSWENNFDGVYEFIIGTRYEGYEQTTNTVNLQTDEPVTSLIDENVVLPSLAFNWYYSIDQQLRLAATETVSRPDFKETSNAVFYDDEFSDVRVVGNPLLDVSSIKNYDLRWEMYGEGENKLSVALFYKDIEDAIERVAQDASGTAGNSRTFLNAESASISGVEFDFRKDFGLNSALTKSVFVAEGDDVDISIVNEGDGTSNPSTGDAVSENCPDFTTALAQEDGVDVCLLPSFIGEDQTLTSDIIWYMQSTVTVGNGNQEMSTTEGILASDDEPVLDLTLTIEAGTEIKADTGSFAALIITRGSELIANGTADAPIIFSSDDDDYVGAGEWGGLVLHGYGLHNQCYDAAGTYTGSAPDFDGSCNIAAEGETGFAGGNTEDDSSGSLSYVIVTEGGYEFAVGNEINGISLVGVGSGTTLSYIQVNDNADDGIEFYGGSAKVDHIVLTGNEDDSIDWDEGFQGNIQYAIVLQSASTGGNSVEADTYGTSGSLFHSNPVVANATFITNGDETEGHVLKSGSGGFFYNTIITPSPASTVALDECVFIDGADAVADAAGKNGIFTRLPLFAIFNAYFLVKGNIFLGSSFFGDGKRLQEVAHVCVLVKPTRVQLFKGAEIRDNLKSDDRIFGASNAINNVIQLPAYNIDKLTVFAFTDGDDTISSLQLTLKLGWAARNNTHHFGMFILTLQDCADTFQ